MTGERRWRSHRRIRFGSGILMAMLAGLAVFATPQAALAAGGVQVSPDGASWGANLTGNLFTGISRFVPGDSETATFYVRNATANPGFLRVTLRHVVSSDSDYADALTVKATTAAQPGAAIPLSAADACVVLLEGQTVPAGGSVAITSTVALGELGGTLGQGASASFDIRVALSDTLPGSLAPTECDYVGGVTLRGVAAPLQPAPQPADPNEAVSPRGLDSGDTRDAELAGGVTPFGWIIDPNTGQLHEELLVFVLFAAFALGAGGFLIVSRRRRRDENGEEVDANS